MRDWAVWQAGADCYSQAALSPNDSKTLYVQLSYVNLRIRGTIGKSPESAISFFTFSYIIYRSFSSTDYTMPTPPWAVFGSTERGFDPEMQRVHRKKKVDPDG